MDAGIGAEGVAEHGADGEPLALAMLGLEVALGMVDDFLGVGTKVLSQIIEVVDDLAHIKDCIRC